ncbi:MAG: extracellular solute-binding protein, partial [Lapillicoccus sp.]
MIKRRATGTALAAVAVAGLASGCLSSNTTTSSGGGGTASGPGKSSIEVMYGFSNQQEVGFQKDVSDYAKTIGVTMKFTKASSWDTEINARVSGGTPPDVGLFPQPGLMCDLAKEGNLIAYDDATVATDKATLVPGLVEAGTCPDKKVYGLPSSVSVKSLLWYDQAAYKAAGVEVPTTLDQLVSVTNQLKSSGKTPWCIAAESGAATGWPITDWIEDLVLRIAGPDNYDKWVKGTLKFNSPEIKPAFEYFQKIAFTDGNVRG